MDHSEANKRSRYYLPLTARQGSSPFLAFSRKFVQFA